MKIKFLLIGTVVLGMTAFTGSASAAPGYLARAVNLRAGPSSHYPIVAKISPRQGLDINGCTQGWKWCDVSAGNLRGWVSGRYLNADYQNRRVAILGGGSNIGLPVVVFNQDQYWGNYYHDQPFYKNYQPHGDVHPQGRGPDRGDPRHDDRRDDDHHR